MLRGAGVNLSQPGVRFYPDGSLLVIDEMNRKLSREIPDVFRQIAPEGVGLVGFRSLAPFGDRSYDLLYPGWYAEKVDKVTGSGVLIWPGIAAQRVPTENDPSRVPVSLEFYRRSQGMSLLTWHVRYEHGLWMSDRRERLRRAELRRSRNNYGTMTRRRRSNSIFTVLAWKRSTR